jgi:hypothetical protein
MSPSTALHSSESVEWYSPPWLVERARQCLGGIDLDPASSHEAQVIVRASEYYTIEGDALGRPWTGNVYLNPPYGRGIGRWVGKLLDEHKAGRVTRAILAVNASTGARWFSQLFAWPICFVAGRVCFLRPGGSEGYAPTHYTAIVHIGEEREAGVFRECFGEVGVIV